MKKSKFATVVLSIVPGLGHFYLGWMERGLQFMLGFFLSIFLMSWLNLSLFAFLLPIIWFYSIFDLMHLSSEPPVHVVRSPLFWLIEKQRWVGIGLIALGALLLFDRTAIPLLRIYLDYHTLRMLTSALLALLFVAGGIRLTLGKQISLPPETDSIGEGIESVTGKDES